MLDPAAVDKEIIDRLGTPPPQADLDMGADAFWQSWLKMTSAAQEFGVPPAALCESVNEIATARAELQSAAHHEGAAATG